MEYAWIIWIIIAVLLFLLEANTVTLTCIWFAVGALITSVLAQFAPSLWLQIACFLILSLLLLFCTKPFLNRHIKKAPTNFDSAVGKQAIVLKTIDNTKGVGQVKLNSSVWSAKSADGVSIEEGELVIVQEIRGVHLVVTNQKG